MPAGGVRGVEDPFVSGLKKVVPQGGADEGGKLRTPIVVKAETMDAAGETAADVRDDAEIKGNNPIGQSP